MIILIALNPFCKNPSFFCCISLAALVLEFYSLTKSVMQKLQNPSPMTSWMQRWVERPRVFLQTTSAAMTEGEQAVQRSWWQPCSCWYGNHTSVHVNCHTDGGNACKERSTVKAIV